MGQRAKETEEANMKCRTCGTKMRRRVTDLPFKVSESSIVIVKRLPVVQCVSCNDLVLLDSVMARVEKILRDVDRSAELEVVQYAA